MDGETDLAAAARRRARLPPFLSERLRNRPEHFPVVVVLSQTGSQSWESPLAELRALCC